MIRLIQKMLLAVLACVGLVAAGHAEKADRDKPILIDAKRCQGDLRTAREVCLGDVIVTQGTFELHADRLDIVQDAEGYQSGVARGGKSGLAHFRQKKEGRDEYIEGQARRIEFDGRTDKLKLFERAFFRSGEGESRGQYMEYDGYHERYVVGDMESSGRKRDERTKLVILPRRHPEEVSAPVAP